MRTERYDTERSGEERLPATGFPDATGDLPASDGDAVTGEEDEEDGEEAGLYEHFAVTADKGQTPLRLDKFLTVRMEHCSRNRIQTAVDSGNILVNGKPAKWTASGSSCPTRGARRSCGPSRCRSTSPTRTTTC